jgi:hypothetical protein
MFQPKTAFEEIARGDLDAYEFLAALFLWVHKEDDLIDRDKPVTPDVIIGLDLKLFQVLMSNPFLQKHKAFLWPIIVTSFISYVASEDMKNREDVLDRISAQVLKSEYINVFFGVAFLVGGYEHALAMSRKYRDYDFDKEPVGNSA